MQERNTINTMLTFIKSLNNIHVTTKGFVYVEPTKRRATSAVPTSFSLEGVLSRGINTSYAIDGLDFKVSSDCWVVGRLEIGAQVKVRGPVSRDGERCATSIVVTKPMMSN